MALWRVILVRLRALFNSDAVHREIDEEMRFHIEMRAEEFVRKGLSPEDALRAAERKFGRLTRIKEMGYEVRGGGSLEMLWKHIRYALRLLRRKPGFTTIAVLTLALGIGSTTAIFSVVYSTLFEAMPYPKPDQLVMVWSSVNQRRNQVSAGDYLEWKRRSESFEYLEAWTRGTFNVSAPERPEQVLAGLMTPGFFRMHGAPMMLGRDFLPEDAESGKDHVVIMSNVLWRRSFGSDREIIGKQIRLNGEPYEVIGVLPAGIHDRRPSQMWLPLAFKPEQINHQSHFLAVMGRLRDGVSIEQANAEMQVITKELSDEFPRTNANWAASVEPLQNDFIPAKTINNLWLLLGAVGFLLLIACVNIANLLLARSATRHREVAIQAALGASRAQIFGQFIVESLILAIIGGGFGIYFGKLIIDGILAILPFQMLPSESDVRISLPVLLFSLFATFVAGMLFGCMPAWQASRLDLNEVLKKSGRIGAGSGGRGLRRALVVVEFALALTLLAAGGLALRSFWNLTQLDLGISPNHVLTFYLPVPQTRFKDIQQINPYYRQLLQKMEGVPGIETATITTGLPVAGTGSSRPFRVAGSPPDDARAHEDVGFQMITSGYFETFGMRLLQGRAFNERDIDGNPRVVIINEAFAKQYFSDADPLLQGILVSEPNPAAAQGGAADSQKSKEIEWQVVGVVNNTRGGDGLRRDAIPIIYIPFWQNPRPRVSVAVRTGSDPERITRDLAQAVNSIDPDIPLAGVKTMNQILDETISFDRFGMVLYGSFAALALLLASIGIYGVMAFAVAQRMHEFGIRMALGAAASHVLKMVLREGGMLALSGLGLGFGGAYLAGRLMQANLYGVSALDVSQFSAVAFVLVASALVACYFPARRASRVDPMVALRDE